MPDVVATRTGSPATTGYTSTKPWWSTATKRVRGPGSTHVKATESPDGVEHEARSRRGSSRRSSRTRASATPHHVRPCPAPRAVPSHATRPRPEAVRYVALAPSTPTRRTIGACGTYSRVVARQRATGPFAASRRSSTAALVSTCRGETPATVTDGARAGLPSTRSTRWRHHLRGTQPARARRGRRERPAVHACGRGPPQSSIRSCAPRCSSSFRGRSSSRCWCRSPHPWPRLSGRFRRDSSRRSSPM